MRKVLLGLVGLLFAASAHAVTVSMTCDAPTEREDGTTLHDSEIVAYRFYKNGGLLHESAQCSYSYNEQTQAVVSYQVTAVDAQGLSSALSDPITLNLSPPVSPKLRVTITVEVSP